MSRIQPRCYRCPKPGVRGLSICALCEELEKQKDDAERLARKSLGTLMPFGDDLYLEEEGDPALIGLTSGGYDLARIELKPLLKWLKENRPDLFKKLCEE